jgi:hypothetical protein
VREAKVNGDAAPFLFLKPVGVDASQRLYQRGFAMVDMTGRSYDDRFHLDEILPETGLVTDFIVFASLEIDQKRP